MVLAGDFKHTYAHAASHLLFTVLEASYVTPRPFACEKRHNHSATQNKPRKQNTKRHSNRWLLLCIETLRQQLLKEKIQYF
jgi:hypothetical protein